jgi:hypothetical protein
MKVIHPEVVAAIERAAPMTDEQRERQIDSLARGARSGGRPETMTDEEILDAAAAIIAKRARVLQLAYIEVDIRPDASFVLHKVGSSGQVTSLYTSSGTRATLGKAWTKEETR